MTKPIRRAAVPHADHPLVPVRVAVGADDVAYIEALAQALNLDGEVSRQLRAKIERMLGSEDERGSQLPPFATLPGDH